MRLLVTGGRGYGVAKLNDSPERQDEAGEERTTLTRALNAFHARHGITQLIHGAAMGADSLARQWAAGRGVGTLAFPAKWYPKGRRGPLDRGAGHKRNAQMLREGRPDAVLSFPGCRGTQGMIRLAMKAGVPVWRVFRPVVLHPSLLGGHGDGGERHVRPIERLRLLNCPHGGQWVEEIEEIFCTPCEERATTDMARAHSRTPQSVGGSSLPR